MRIHALIAVIAFGSMSCLVLAQAKKAPAAPASQLNRNLIQNGDAEAEGEDEKHVPRWPQQEGFTEVRYGSVSGEWDWGLSGCAACGNRYLRLQFEGDTHELSVSQTIDVSSIATDIDKKTVTASISAYLGGFHDSDTTGQIIVSFQDASGSELGKIGTAAYDTKQLLKAEKGNAGLVPCEVSGQVPAGTRKIVYTWKASATGTSSDYLGLGDNFSLVLTEVQPS
jgi:hypothetical protein